MANTSRVKTWQSGDTLTAADLNTEFNNLLTGGINSIANANVATDAAIAESKLAFSGSGHGHTGGTDGKTITVPTDHRAFAWYISGTLVAGTNYGPRYVVPEAMTILKVWLIVRTAPTSAAILIDINKNGSTIWSTQGNRATIAASASAGNTTTFNTTALAAGDYLDLDIDQIGSSVAGADLTVVLECSEP